MIVEERGKGVSAYLSLFVYVNGRIHFRVSGRHQINE